MTFKQLLTAIRTAWQSRPLAIILPILALVWYWYHHGHKIVLATVANGGSLPDWQTFVMGAGLLATKFERLTEFLFGVPPAATLPAPVAAPAFVVPPPGDGPKAAIVLLLGLALGLTSCAKNPPGAPPTPVGTFGHCTTEALRTASEGILGDVTTALATGDYVSAVNALAVRFGTAEVGCAIDLVIAEFRAKAARSNDQQVALVLQHAQAWRLANP